jgi:hypothetical protein
MTVSNNITWVNLVHPGELPVHGTSVTTILRKQINCQYDTDLAAYQLYSKVSNALKHQILLAVESTFLQAIAHPRLGFMTVTRLVMIHHLDETYGTLTLGEIEASCLALSTPWNPDRPIEDLRVMVPSQPLLLQQQLLEWQNHALLKLTSCVMGSNSTTVGPMG